MTKRSSSRSAARGGRPVMAFWRRNSPLTPSRIAAPTDGPAGRSSGARAAKASSAAGAAADNVAVDGNSALAWVIPIRSSTERARVNRDRSAFATLPLPDGRNIAWGPLHGTGEHGQHEFLRRRPAAPADHRWQASGARRHRDPLPHHGAGRGSPPVPALLWQPARRAEPLRRHPRGLRGLLRHGLSRPARLDVPGARTGTGTPCRAISRRRCPAPSSRPGSRTCCRPRRVCPRFPRQPLSP